MHSKTTSGRVLRMTPYLITVGLGFSIAAQAATPAKEVGVADKGVAVADTAVQKPSGDNVSSEIPAPTIDTDGDGKADAWDRSGNGQPDAWDTDGDGKPDLLDDNADGKPD